MTKEMRDDEEEDGQRAGCDDGRWGGVWWWEGVGGVMVGGRRVVCWWKGVEMDGGMWCHAAAGPRRAPLMSDDDDDEGVSCLLPVCQLRVVVVGGWMIDSMCSAEWMLVDGWCNVMTCSIPRNTMSIRNLSAKILFDKRRKIGQMRLVSCSDACSCELWHHCVCVHWAHRKCICRNRTWDESTQENQFTSPYLWSERIKRPISLGQRCVLFKCQTLPPCGQTTTLHTFTGIEKKIKLASSNETS